jgi:hypothetical protein
MDAILEDVQREIDTLRGVAAANASLAAKYDYWKGSVTSDLLIAGRLESLIRKHGG